MHSAQKRKGSPSLEEEAESSKRRFAEKEIVTTGGVPRPTSPNDEHGATIDAPIEDGAETSTPEPAANDRTARFAALRARNQVSRKENLKATKFEAKRQSVDPSQLTALNRKRDIAEHKLLKAETEEAGEDFERKRAWDWTVEESERWDKHMAKKERNRENVAFQDYGREAGKVYKRQVRTLEKAGKDERQQAYEREKNESIERAVQSGGLEVVETADGELLAVDKDGSFYNAADITQFSQNKPDKAAVDRLVADLRKAEEARLKRRRDRGRTDDSGQDVTYINEKNKQFNAKLSRAYDKYTKEIRDSFERGTAI